MNEPLQPDQTAEEERLPRWLKRKIPKGGLGKTDRILEEQGLETVCHHARCPNRMECFSKRTATFLILGDTCTRSCAFCSINKGLPGPIDPDEPYRVARAVEKLGLRHAVITAVTRDDLPDGGADHFRRTVLAVRKRTGATVEVLPSDFGGSLEAVDRLLAARPEVYAYNAETIPRLYRPVRGVRPQFTETLAIFRHLKKNAPSIPTKTGLILGLGETTDELLDWLAELREAGARWLTLGQYLRPSAAQMKVVRYVPPEEFDRLKEQALAIGFEQVAAGPFVRSSYHAAEFLAGETDCDG